LEETARLLLPAISAVGTAHSRGIVHRDLKPENIYLSRTDDGIVVKVLDFGIAKLSDSMVADSFSGTRTGTTLGTPFYMAPEQAAGDGNVDHRADIWAFGVILYECLSGVRPIEGDNVPQVVMHLMSTGIVPLGRVARGIPVEVTVVIDRMLTRERSRRPQNLLEVARLISEHSGVPFAAFEAPAVRSTPEPAETAAPLASSAAVPKIHEAGASEGRANVISAAPPDSRRVRHASLRTVVSVLAALALLAAVAIWRFFSYR
jgi:serine/threonine-protein kinase